jgi:hypothetical protein
VSYARSLREQASVEQPPPESPRCRHPSSTIRGIGVSARKRCAIAEQMSDLQSKDAMLRIAKDYERLAERAEQRGKGSGQAI